MHLKLRHLGRMTRQELNPQTMSNYKKNLKI